MLAQWEQHDLTGLPPHDRATASPSRSAVGAAAASAPGRDPDDAVPLVARRVATSVRAGLIAAECVIGYRQPW